MSIKHRIIIEPIITEKGTLLRENNKYLFKVDRKASKSSIKKAVEELFDVSVLKINTVNVRGKVKRMGRYVGKRPDWKKAIIKLPEGQTIEKLGEV